MANVRFEVDGNRVLINYDLVGSGKQYSVRIRFSGDGGRTFTTITSVAQDVGEGIVPGPARTIIWDLLADMPDGILSDKVLFEVTASMMPEKKRRGLTYLIAGALIAGAGGTAALLLGGSSGGSEGPDPSGFPGPPGRPPGT